MKQYKEEICGMEEEYHEQLEAQFQLEQSEKKEQARFNLWEQEMNKAAYFGEEKIEYN